ncbi:hypothetical protein AC579_2353 [Pseudocercospora musae]|uniref:Uncharacterized protein n=1 Tax=Pseudocercospora musae TaxID=113226 RepID=A0A139IGD2_9PEZI|nr:hypothetical protein AC579_2353 [Pseudocercospora musae]
MATSTRQLRNGIGQYHNSVPKQTFETSSDRNGKATAEYAWHNCDNICLRYMVTGKAGTSNDSTAAPGTPLHYKDSNHIVIDHDTRLIHNVTSSSDLVRWILELGSKNSPAELFDACKDPKEEGCDSKSRKRDS